MDYTAPSDGTLTIRAYGGPGHIECRIVDGGETYLVLRVYRSDPWKMRVVGGVTLRLTGTGPTVGIALAFAPV